MAIISSDYLNIITSEHRDKPKYMATVERVLGYLDDMYLFLGQINDVVDIESSVGKQLDLIGEYVNVGRVLPFSPEEGYSQTLNDDDYRFLIKARILWNTWDGTVEGLESIWSQMFPNILLYHVQQDQMTEVFYILFDDSNNIKIQMILNDMILPRPTGVRYLINILGFSSDLPLFGLDMATDIVNGFDLGHWFALGAWYDLVDSNGAYLLDANGYQLQCL